MARESGMMSVTTRVLLFWYLTLMSVVLLYAFYGIWGAVAAPEQQEVIEEPDFSATSAPTDGSPQVLKLDPEKVSIGTGRGNVRIFGHNFTRTSEVRFDGAMRPANFVSSNHLVSNLASSDFVASGKIAVTVSNGLKTSEPVNLLIESSASPPGKWKFFAFEVGLSAELRLLLLVIFAGAFGASIIALQSFADYRGEKQLGASWAIFYLVRPQIGAGVAVVFYYVIRGGFLAGTSVEYGTETPFGIVALSALVGMFSDKAVLKLNEVFTSLFKSDDKRRDKLGGPVIATKNLPNATHNQVYDYVLKASGGQRPFTWTVEPQLPDGLDLNPDSGQISGTPTAASKRARYTFTITDAKDLTSTKDLELVVN